MGYLDRRENPLTAMLFVGSVQLTLRSNFPNASTRERTQGDYIEDLHRELGLSHSRNYLPELCHRHRQGGSCWETRADRRHSPPYKATPEHQAWLRKQKRENPSLAQQELARLSEEKFQVSISSLAVVPPVRPGSSLPSALDPPPGPWEWDASPVVVPP